ncbi:MAG: hypothetical protein MK008_04330 [Bdellovibrionales bacterium]|nr:hypothetical protein [Bdellovibrionales bacterium]
MRLESTTLTLPPYTKKSSEPLQSFFRFKCLSYFVFEKYQSDTSYSEFILSSAASVVLGGGTMQASPGIHLSGVAKPVASVFIAMVKIAKQDTHALLRDR